MDYELPYAVSQPAMELKTIDSAIAHAQTVIAARAEERTKPLWKWLYKNGLSSFYLAGGALLPGKPEDLDLFPDSENVRQRAAFSQIVVDLRGQRVPVLSISDSSLVGPIPVQLINYVPEVMKAEGGLATLVEDFDFAHCKVGVWMHLSSDRYVAGRTYISPAFIAARLMGGTFYTAGASPLRSLARVGKVALKLGLSSLEAHRLAKQVVDHLAAQGQPLAKDGAGPGGETA